ncbi:MAG: AI-2E family transporter [Halothece sp.]
MLKESKRDRATYSPIASWLKDFRATIPNWILLLLIFPLIILDGWLFLVFIDYFNQLITTFIAATLLAFLLNYPTQILEKFQVRRSYAVLIVFFTTVIILGLITLLSLPFIIDQFEKFRNQIPIWIDSSEYQLEQIAAIFQVNFSDWSNDLQRTLKTQIQLFLKSLPNLALGTVGNFLQIFFILVLTVFLSIFYKGLLKNTIETWFPNTSPQVLRSLRRNFNSYVINQFTLSLSLTAFMIPTFWFLNVPFYLLFALTIGIMGLIPFGAILTIFIIGFLLGLKSIWLGLKVLVVALIIDQIIENTVTPRLLGTLTGLNPIVVLFSLMVGARISGYFGVLIAVPITATIKSTLRLSSQKNSVSLEESPTENY